MVAACGLPARKGWDATKLSSRLVEQLPAAIAPVHIEMLLAIVKFDRFEWALEKATELGDKVTPLAADRGEKGLIAAAGKRAERWKRMLTESAQQSRRLRVPSLLTR